MLQLSATFDLQRDVVPDIFRKEGSIAPIGEYSVAVDARIVNIERDGGVLYSWKGATGTTKIGKYDTTTKQNKLLYTFDKQVCVSSCSLNQEETLLAVSLAQRTNAEERLRPVSECLTLLIEIRPVNNTPKVLKAVDCRVRVQFLHPEADRSGVLESHLLLLAADGYVDLYHVMLVKKEGYRVVMSNSERMAKDRVAEDLSWAQWDAHTQRLFYLIYKDKPLLKCVQFHANHNCETVLELALDLPSNPFTSLRFVNLGFDHYQKEEQEQDEPIRMIVFTNKTGSMCVCYSQPAAGHPERGYHYTVVLVHRGCSKTFSGVLDSRTPINIKDLHPLFIPLGYYVLVYLPGHFLHCVNSRQHELLCHSLFLSGAEADLGLPAGGGVVSWLSDSASLLDLSSGRMFSVDVNADFLLQLLQTDTRRPDSQRLAALHCLLVYLEPDPALELRIIDWICDNVMAFDTFDQIQEFILASLYRTLYHKSLSLDNVLPYSSMFERKELHASLDEVAGVHCTTELHADPVFSGKARSVQGYWEELRWSSERTRYFEAVPHPRYRPSQLTNHWTQLEQDLKSEKKMLNIQRHIEDNAKKVLSMVDTWRLDKKLVPLFQEEDHQQRVLIGLMVDKLREHLIRHLPRLGKKKIDSLVVDYVAKLLELIRHMLESVWLKYKLGPGAMCFNQQGSPEEWATFHVMCRILEATKGLCLPLPPGYHTLLSVLGVRCLPRHVFFQHVDQRLLQLSETFVTHIMKDLDNSASNEELKFSILKRLPEPLQQRICQLWDHPISSACISRAYVTVLLRKHIAKTKGSPFIVRDMASFRPEFLPLTYLAKILADLESQALNPFEEQENVDARFVEETALKQTLKLLGFEVK